MNQKQKEKSKPTRSENNKIAFSGPMHTPFSGFNSVSVSAAMAVMNSDSPDVDGEDANRFCSSIRQWLVAERGMDPESPATEHIIDEAQRIAGILREIHGIMPGFN